MQGYYLILDLIEIHKNFPKKKKILANLPKSLETFEKFHIIIFIKILN